MGMAGAMVGAAAISAGAGIYSSSQASKAQGKAAQQAADSQSAIAAEDRALQKEIFDQQRADTIANADLARKYIGNAVPAAADALRTGSEAATNYLTDGYGRAIDSATAGFGQARGDINAGFDQARNDAYSGYTQARSDVTSGYDAARNPIQPYASTGTDALNRLYKTYITGETPYQATDPGYAWRLKQGQQAVERSAAARGGLFSGATGKALTDYAQGEASQEFGNSYNRLADVVKTGYAANAALSDLEANRGNTLAQLASSNGNTLAQLAANRGTALGDVSQNQGRTLAELYGQQGTALAGNAMDYGTRVADLHTNLGTAMANVTTGQSAQTNALATQYGSTSHNILGNLSQGLSASQMAAGEARASGYLGAGSAISKSTNSLAMLYGMGAFGKSGGINGSGGMSGYSPSGAMLMGSSGMLGGRV